MNINPAQDILGITGIRVLLLAGVCFVAVAFGMAAASLGRGRLLRIIRRLTPIWLLAGGSNGFDPDLAFLVFVICNFGLY
jgi:hypothetical protein